MPLDPVLVAAGASLVGGVAALAALPALGLALFALLVFRSALGGRGVALAVCALGFGFARATLLLNHFETERVAARDAIGRPDRCDLTLRVASSPAWSGDAAAYSAELLRGECAERPLRAGWRVRLHGGPGDLARGDIVHAIADLAPVQLFRNLGLTDPKAVAARQGILLSGGVLALDVLKRSSGLAALIDHARSHARERIVATFAPAAAGMARALVLGENDLSPDDASAFQASGLSHMLAVSGTHLVFAVLALVRALKSILVRVESLAARFDVERAAAAFGALASLLYADFAGGSGSAWRAAFMLAAGLGARACGRRPVTLRAVALSLAVGVALDPLCAFDLSFMLSLAATAGLLCIGRPLAGVCDRLEWRPARAIATSFVATLSATLPCAPLLAMLSSGLTLAGLLANVVAAPFGEAVALPLCLSHALLGALPSLERGVALVASGALLVVKRIAYASAAARCLSVPLVQPNGCEFALLAAGALCLWACPVPPGASRVARWALRGAVCACALLALVSVECATRSAGRPRGVLRVTALDVGQGDSNLVDFPNGTLLLVDGGGFVGSPVDPGKAVIVPVLRARRRPRVDVMVLSHPHPDHFTGLLSTLAAIDVGEFWDTGQGQAEGAGPVYRELMQALVRRHIPVRHPSELCAAPRVFGGATLEVLAPCPRFVPGRGANDNSLVLRVQYGKRSVLLTGDAEAAEEADLLAGHAAELHADFLKVGHHGSRTSSGTRFLQAVSPLLATISCGVRNRFGHPHAEAVERLRARGVRALRLDRAGSVVFETDGVAAHAWAFTADGDVY